MDFRIIFILAFGLLQLVQAEPQKQSNSLKDKPDPTKAKILKQINRVNDDGSYTFGYEADDGSFKVETRNKDGVVKGKYGFLDGSGQLKTVEYSAGEKAVKEKRNKRTEEDDDVKDQSTASATTDPKSIRSKDREDDDGSYNGESDGPIDRQDDGPIDRQDDGQSQYLRQVGNGGGSRFAPTTQLAGGRFNNPEEQPQYQSGAGPASQYEGQEQYLGGRGGGQQFGGPQAQYLGGGGGGQQFGEDPRQQFSGGFSPSQFGGGQGIPARFQGQGGGQLLGGGEQGQFLPQQFAGRGQGQGQEYQFNPYQQQQFLGGQQGGQYDPEQFSGSPQLGGGPQSARVGGIGRPDLQIPNNFEQSQYSDPRQFGGPNRFSSGARGPGGELAYQGRPSSLGQGGGSSQESYVPTVELEGFSEDADQDGYVDPYPGQRGSATGGDVKTAQAAEKTPAVKTPSGEKVTFGQEYNPQVLGPEGSPRLPQGQLLGGQGGQFGGVSPYNEQQLQQLYLQQAQAQRQFPGSPQQGFGGHPQFQGQPGIIGGGQGGSPYQGQGIPFQGQGIQQSQSPFQGQIVQSDSPYQGLGINPSQLGGQGISPGQFQGQGQFQSQGRPDIQGIQGGRPDIQGIQGGRPDLQGSARPELQGQGRPDLQGLPPQFQGGRPGAQFQGQPQFNPQQIQFSPEFQQGGGPQQFLGGQGLPSQGGQYIGGGFQPNFQGGPIPPQYFQGGRGQQFSPQQGGPSPYAVGGIRSAGFPFDYSPYAGLGIGGGPQGFQGSPHYTQISQQPGGPSPSPASGAGDKSDDEKKA